MRLFSWFFSLTFINERAASGKTGTVLIVAVASSGQNEGTEIENLMTTDKSFKPQAKTM